MPLIKREASKRAAGVHARKVGTMISGASASPVSSPRGSIIFKPGSRHHCPPLSKDHLQL